MKKEYLTILTNIIGGVESGGQTYGKRKYGAYAGKAANADNEKTCTLGWAQNYGNEGRRLCQMILKADPKAFRTADTAGIEKKLSVDWEATRWNPTAKEKAALIAIITTDAGKKCQDDLFKELMEKYIAEAEVYGVDNIQAQMMWCEVEHLGGLKPVKRIFARAKKPYTPDTVYASLILDQKDTSNDNQVGDKKFESRHQCCVRWIKQYVVDNVDKSVYKSISSAFFHPQSVDKKLIKNGYPHANRNITPCFCAEFHLNFTCFVLHGKRWKINYLIIEKLK